jgi:hypothetical protein
MRELSRGDQFLRYMTSPDYFNDIQQEIYLWETGLLLI